MLYAVNTAGAAAGCFLTDFALVPAWGLLETQFLAVALNVIAGAGAIALSKSQIPNPKAQIPKNRAQDRIRANESRIPSPESRPGAPSLRSRIALALSGFARSGMEILWFRHFSIMLGAFRAVFSLLLTVILVGIGAGALAAGALQRRVRSSPGALLIAHAVAVCRLHARGHVVAPIRASSTARFQTPCARLAPRRPSTSSRHRTVWNELWFNLRPMLLEVAFPALLIGFSFPLAQRA